MKIRSMFIIICLFIVFIQGCGVEERKVSHFLPKKEVTISFKKQLENNKTKQLLDVHEFNREPMEWGEEVTGVKTRIKTEEKEIALTFDACNLPYDNSVDYKLINFLITEKIPATLFINEQWIEANKEVFLSLAKNSLFQIENHGSNHSPLSVNGGEAWGIPATTSPQEVYDEIMENHSTVRELTGKEMTLFRSGTAFYDEVAVKIAKALNYEAVNFDILGDAGATYSSEQVKNALLQAKEGSIALMHMNHPESGTASGVKQAIPILIERGYKFVLLEDKQLE